MFPMAASAPAGPGPTPRPADPWSVRRWALGIVEEAVMFKVERDCYPTLDLTGEDTVGDGWPVAYEQGWETRSLLGAVWLQMLWLMAGDDNKCEWCGALFEKPQPNKRFCTDKPCSRMRTTCERGRGNAGSRRGRLHQPRINPGEHRRMFATT